MWVGVGEVGCVGWGRCKLVCLLGRCEVCTCLWKVCNRMWIGVCVWYGVWVELGVKYGVWIGLGVGWG